MILKGSLNRPFKAWAIITLSILAWNTTHLLGCSLTWYTSDFKVLGFLPYWISNYKPKYEYLDYIAWFAVEINGYGEITDLHGWPLTSLIREAHSNNVKVMVTVACFHSNSLDRVLAYHSEKLSHELVQVVSNSDGIVIDFEGIRRYNSYTGVENSLLLTRFMKILRNTLKNSDSSLQICICLPPVDWSNVFNCTMLSDYVDMFYIMAYDYHWQYSPVSGPVSPLRGEEYCVEHTLDHYLKQAHPSKFILGLPLYGWDWPTKNDEKHSETLGPGSAVVLWKAVRNAEIYGRRWDDETKSAWYAYRKGSVWHQCWYEDPESLALKYRLTESKRLRGVGFWALGYEGEHAEIYEAIPHGKMNPNPLKGQSRRLTQHDIFRKPL